MAGEVLLEDGTKYTGDLVIGADGVHVSSWTHPPHKIPRQQTDSPDASAK